MHAPRLNLLHFVNDCILVTTKYKSTRSGLSVSGCIIRTIGRIDFHNLIKFSLIHVYNYGLLYIFYYSYCNFLIYLFCMFFLNYSILKQGLLVNLIKQPIQLFSHNNFLGIYVYLPILLI